MFDSSGLPPSDDNLLANSLKNSPLVGFLTQEKIAGFFLPTLVDSAPISTSVGFRAKLDSEKLAMYLSERCGRRRLAPT